MNFHPFLIAFQHVGGFIVAARKQQQQTLPIAQCAESEVGILSTLYCSVPDTEQ